ncbi:MAG TPA: 16S rRNA (adenine(1518)-N(6)/adenine(1519)-N(6))-dimethyltransferase RsmA [Thermoplasmata archaeon]|nr:16S rRNA (adenine(1518)-N(6)/adenine(1519)-N(6))-dimethyltransferase RsmA [Thermoplasmata archaeon]
MRSRDVSAELRRLGVRASRGLGQHFLIDERVARRQVERAQIRPDETVLEVGPGLGVLTELLATRAKRVVAIERDRRLADALQDLGDRVEVVRGDALRTEWPAFDVMVSNLPYTISSPVTFKLLDHPFDRAVLMFQREFAERLVARPGTKDYSRLTVNAAHRAAGEILERVPRSAFHPQPRVDSAVVRLVRRPPAYHVMDEDTFHAVVDACFAHRRKTVGNSLAIEWKRFAQDRTSWREILPALPFQARRPESVAPEEFATLANAVSGAKG